MSPEFSLLANMAEATPTITATDPGPQPPPRLIRGRRPSVRRSRGLVARHRTATETSPMPAQPGPPRSWRQRISHRGSQRRTAGPLLSPDRGPPLQPQWKRKVVGGRRGLLVGLATETFPAAGTPRSLRPRLVSPRCDVPAAEVTSGSPWPRRRPRATSLATTTAIFPPRTTWRSRRRGLLGSTTATTTEASARPRRRRRLTAAAPENATPGPRPSASLSASGREERARSSPPGYDRALLARRGAAREGRSDANATSHDGILLYFFIHLQLFSFMRACRAFFHERVSGFWRSRPICKSSVQYNTVGS